MRERERERTERNHVNSAGEAMGTYMVTNAESRTIYQNAIAHSLSKHYSRTSFSFSFHRVKPLLFSFLLFPLCK